MTLSRTQIDKLGDRLRRDEIPTDDDLRLLSEFREDRRSAMEAIGSGLGEIVGTPPAGRLKTINSIVDKLRRESARLSQVQDIAGLRVVRDMSRPEQDELVSRIIARLPDSKVFDRRANPSHGYRAVHVVATVDRHLVEIQVRTELQHRWALLVERFASAWGQQIKYGGVPNDPDAVVDGSTRRELTARLASLSSTVDLAEQDVPVRLRQHLADDLFVSGVEARMWATRWLAIMDRVAL